MSLEQVNQALLGHLSPSEELICKLLAPIKSMQIIFGGFLVTPHSAWMENRPSVMVFPNSDCALSFSICLQLALLHAPWTEEVTPRALQTSHSPSRPGE